MAITYSWKVTSIRVKQQETLSDVVVQTYWEKIGVDEFGNEGKFSGATPFSEKNIDPGQFIPFEQLTEEIIISWIKAVVVGEYETHVNEVIAKQIDDKKYVVQDKPLPWASTATVTPATTSENINPPV
jgi:hypothetical protein